MLKILPYEQNGKSMDNEHPPQHTHIHPTHVSRVHLIKTIIL